MNIVVKILDRVFVLLGALFFMQAPQFIQDYLHVLYGHLAELTWQLDQMRSMSAKSGKTLTDLVAKFLKSTDPDIVFQGELLDKLLQREEAFTAAVNALTHASPFSKPFLFLRHASVDLIQETWKHFKIGLPITLEALGWGAMGFVFGYFIFSLLRISALVSENKNHAKQVGR